MDYSRKVICERVDFLIEEGEKYSENGIYMNFGSLALSHINSLRLQYVKYGFCTPLSTDNYSQYKQVNLLDWMSLNMQFDDPAGGKVYTKFAEFNAEPFYLTESQNIQGVKETIEIVNRNLLMFKSSVEKYLQRRRSLLFKYPDFEDAMGQQ
ncbi:MAG: hypothetical protein R2827_15600 [Bdellovibrionales bacterium]